MNNAKQIDILSITLLLLIIQVVLGINNIDFSQSTIGFVVFIIYDIYLIYKLNKVHIRNFNRSRYTSKMLLLTLFYYILYFYLGFAIGFARSPYSHTLYMILSNVIKSLVLILAVEFSRYLYLNKNKENVIIMIIFTILLICLELDINRVITLINTGGREEKFKYFFETILPLISSSALFSYLTIISNYKTTLVYRIITTCVFFIMPIFPNVNWFLNASLGILVPAVFHTLYKFVYTKNEGVSKRKVKSSKVSLAIAIVSMSLLVAFMFGMFKCEPVTIVSNSMLPTYSRGDVIVYEKMSSDDLIKLEKDSIIVYRVENQLVAHRVVNVIQENGTTMFQTKGDNNNSPDFDLVEINQIVGVYRFHLKYIGYPSVWLNDFFNDEEAKVETK